MTVEEALAAIDDAMVENRFGMAGIEVVIEEYLEGEEASFFALCDGAHALPLGAAQDHKRVGDGDTGPNTGGMGAYSPAPVVTPAMAERIMREVINPTVAGMANENRPFRGVLFAGLMIGAKGPQLIEYNVRFGDPECQVLMPRLKSDLLPALIAAAPKAAAAACWPAAVACSA
jgi:phosphoribosylamine--glycine ligase